VTRRLAKYGAAEPVRDENAAVPDPLADACFVAMSRRPAYRLVGTDGADRAAALLAELV